MPDRLFKIPAVVPGQPADGPQAVEVQQEELIRRLAAQDPRQAAAWLFRQYARALCSHAYRFVQHRQVAEDLVADVFCELLTRGHFASISTSYRAYLFVAVRNRACNYLRQELLQRPPLPAHHDPAGCEATHPDRLLEQDELLLALQQGLEALPPQQQRIFLMHRFEGKKYREIALELGLSPKTVENHLLRSLAALRAFLLYKDVLMLGFMLTAFY